MRCLISLIIVAASFPVAAIAQESSTRSVDDYICELTDECGSEAAATEMPSERGKPRASAVRGLSLTKSPDPAAKPAASKRGRVDLRLTFAYNSAELTPQDKAEARVFAQALKRPQLSSRKLAIEGHTDAKGSRLYNLDLSQRRARAVTNYLTSLGIPRDRFQVRGYGFDRPLPGRSASSPDNRRVEAVLVS